ncbi:mucin-5AC isoform X2 [Drosophila mojavensis]|uniref:Uncharacterized protein, isoform E n=1 Tax=Drosophila mojavensis TaxID=7230 RepID=A0A0Q9X963_DROMO|nr:mucin-5AC isoform X2 [Drosophila mojavensis]KRG04959.1 uncharacterized protein Dmoj_GI20755, isoform E [Drosophila mojavensis]
MQTRSLKYGLRSRRAAGVTVTLLLALALLRIDAATGRPDVRQSPFSLELQPPLAEAAAGDAFNAGSERATDSYGNPIDALRPIDTPDGRKVVSAQGLQFEIPNYASGITEIRKPADDLLPPHIGEFTTTAGATKATTATATTTTTSKAAATTTTTAATTIASTLRNRINQKRNTQAALVNSTNSLSITATPSSTTTATLPPSRTPTYVAPLTKSESQLDSAHGKRESSGQQYKITAASAQHAPPTFTLLTLNPEFRPLESPRPQPRPQPRPRPRPRPKANNDSLALIAYSTPTPTPSQLDAIAVAVPSTDIDSTDSTSFAPAPDTSLTPPKHESSTTTTTAEDIAVEVEQAQLVPLNQQQPEESAQTPQQTDGTLPDYLLELQQQDKDIAGPVPWTPAPNAAPLSVIAWDLLPPVEAQRESEPHIITEQQPTKYVVGVEQPGSHNIRVSLSSGQGLSPVAPAPLKPGQVAVVPVPVRDGPEGHGTNAHVGTTTPRNGARFPNRHRGTVHYSTASATQRPRSTTTTTTTTSTTTTTTTPRPTTTTTTTRRATTTTTPATTTTRSPPRSTTPLDPSTFYKLDNEEAYAYTLPPWLQEVTDPDLDVAVTFIVPTDNDQYNHTVPEDLEPPFEPFVDLSNIQLTPPPESKSTTSTTTTTSRPTTTTRTTPTTTTTTTRRPSTTTTQAPAPIAARTTQAPIFRAQTTQWSHAKNQLITTTTTTSTAPPSVEPNPFDSSTLPPWLQDFDYPDVGPGVPYDPENFKDVPETKPGERFAAPPVGQITETKSAAAAAAEQQFPPFSAASAGDIPKVEYTKSDGGKVISTPINVQRPEPAVVSTTSASATNTGKYTGGFGAPAGLLRPLTGTKPDIYVAGNNHEYSTRVKANRVRPGAATETATAGNGGRYTGGFGAPSGVLSPQNVPRPFQQSQQSQQSSSQPSHLAGAASSHHQSRFGGPPGILVPFDNVPRTGAK